MCVFDTSQSVCSSVCLHESLHTHSVERAFARVCEDMRVCLLVYFWRISLVHHLPRPSKINDSSLDANLSFIIPSIIFILRRPCFLTARERDSALCLLSVPLAVFKSLFSNMILVNHYLPCPLLTGTTGLQSRELKQTAFNMSVC